MHLSLFSLHIHVAPAKASSAHAFESFDEAIERFTGLTPAQVTAAIDRHVDNLHIDRAHLEALLRRHSFHPDEIARVVRDLYGDDRELAPGPRLLRAALLRFVTGCLDSLLADQQAPRGA